MPVPVSGAGAVRAKTTNRPASVALVMNCLVPSMTQPSPSGLAVVLQAGGVRSGAGFGQRERRDDVAGGDAGQPPCLLLLGAEPDQHLTGDPVVGAEHRAQRQRRVAELHRDLDVLDQVEPQPAPLLRDGVAEQTHLGRLRPQVRREWRRWP